MQDNTKNECLLKRVEEQEIAAREYGFYWENIHQLIEQIQSECNEILEAWQKKDQKHLQEEIGDLIQASVSLAVFCEMDPRETLLRSIDKFQKRYDKVVELAKEDGYSHLHQQPFEKLMHYWNRAKKPNSEK